MAWGCRVGRGIAFGAILALLCACQMDIYMYRSTNLERGDVIEEVPDPAKGGEGGSAGGWKRPQSPAGGRVKP